ncbi:MAG TPA: hypothetical protein VF608_05695, partial [Thermoanaerobaculia bacterium]
MLLLERSSADATQPQNAEELIRQRAASALSFRPTEARLWRVPYRPYDASRKGDKPWQSREALVAMMTSLEVNHIDRGSSRDAFMQFLTGNISGATTVLENKLGGNSEQLVYERLELT